MKIWVKILLILILLPLSWSIYYYPYEYGRIWHLIFTNPDLYKPNVLEHDVRLFKSREYIFDLDFDNFDYHDVGVIFSKVVVPSSLSKSSSPYVFNGEVVVELLNNGAVVRKSVITEPLSFKYDDTDLEFYKSMVLDRFPLPIKGMYSGYKLRLTVLEPDPYLEKNDVDVYFSVSTSL